PGSADAQPNGVASTGNVAQNIVDTPNLRFWNLRDQLISGRGNRWSPVEFAVAELNRIEREAASLELQNWYKQQPSQSAFSSRADEFDRLQNLLDAPTVSSPRPSLRSSGLLGSWFNLQAKLASKSDPRIPWLQPEVFPDSEREQWLATRGDYSAYMHALQQIAMQLGSWEDIDLPRHQWNNVERLLSKLERVQSAMPQDAATYLENHHSDNKLASLMNPIREDLQTLREGRGEEIRQLASLDSKEWNWGHERVFLSLLGDPSLPLESRAELEKLRKNLESLRSTGIALELPAQRRPLSQLTPINADCQTEDLQRLKSQYAATQKALALMGDQDNNRISALDAATTAEQLNRWGAEWIEYWQANVESNSPTQRWNRCCLAELLPLMSDPSELAVDPDDEIALLLPYSNDFSLVPSLPTAIRLDATAGGSASWKIPIRRRNGTSVNTCSVSLTAVDSSSTTNFADQLLVQLGRGNNQPWTIGEQRRVNTELDGSQEFLRLNLNWRADLKSLPDDLSISLDIRDETAESPRALESVAQIRVLPPRRDIVELVIRPTSGNEQAVVRSELEGELGNLHSAMKVPAVGHRAKSVYQFFVRNRSDRKKSVVVQLFPVIAPQTLLTGNGKVDGPLATLTLDAVSAGELSPIFESAPIELPADDGLDDHPVLFLPSENSPPPVLTGEFGFLCVIKETPSGEPNSGQTQTTYEWIECSAYSGPELLQLEFPELRGEFVVSVAPTKYWSDFQLEEMQVSGQLTDALGRRIEHQGDAPLTLKPGMSPQIMRFRPSNLQQNQGEKFVLQLDAGDYPRARSIASSLRGRVDWENVTQALAEFNRASLRCLQANGTPIACDWIEDQSGSMELVVPNRIGASDLGVGDKVTVAKIAGALTADFPKKGLAASGLLALGDHMQRRLHSDRKLQPRLDLKGPDLIFTCRASDIDFELDTQAIADRLEGPQELRFSIAGSDQILDTLRLNFDQRPPEPAAILVGEGDRRLFLGESLLLSISPVDNVEVQSVWFAIDQGQRDQMKFDEADLQHIQAKSLGEAWEETLKADELKQQPLRPGMEYRIVCRTIDVAGNIQDQNIPGTFLWMGKERPQSNASSAPEPSKKEDKPTTSWVTIVVSAPGSSRFDGSRVQLSGLSAKRKFYAGNGEWKFTDVPPGTYEVTAKYTDARNTAYEGQATVSVPGNEVSLQLRQAKQ
ncbi:MAG: hypothetical protein NXI32_27350, partial [bacterium]|nr:hypothetical protein [bacterium]